MSKSRTFNSVRNIVWAVLHKLIIILLPFVVRTVMIHRLGTEYTGLGNLFTSLLTVFSLAELGFSSAMVYCMYEPVYNNDKMTICALLNLYKKIYRIIGLVILVAGIGVLPFLPRLIHNDIPGDINIYILYLIYLLNTVISYFMFAYKSSLMVAYQQNNIVSIIGMMGNVGLYVLQIAVLIVTESFYLYAALLPVSTVAMNLGYEAVSRRLYPDIECRGEVCPQLKEKIKKRVAGMMLYKISSTTRTSFDSVVISVFLGLATLTKYQNYFMIISSVLGVLSVISSATTASVGNSIVAKDRKENYADFKKFVFIYMWIAGLCAICIGYLIQPFMRMWMGQDLMLDNTMALLFGIYFYAQTMGDIVFLYRTAAGLWWKDRVRPVTEAVSNIVLNILLVKLWGLYGVIIATIITLLGINFLWGAHILFKHYFLCSMKQYIAVQLKQAAVTAFAAVIMFLLCRFLSGEGILVFVGRMLMCIVVANIIFFVCNRRSEQFGQAKDFIIRVLRIVLKRKDV